MRYYNKANGTEVRDNPLVPEQMRYNADNPNHVALPESNPFFHPLPEGFELTYNGANVPTALAEIPDYWLNKAKGEKVSEVYTAFYDQAVLQGVPYPYEAVKQELDLRGVPPSPSPAQTAVYTNVGIADTTIASINALTTVQAVEAFDVSATVWST